MASDPVNAIVQETKPLWASKTLWFNAGLALAPLLYPPAGAWIAANPEAYSALIGALGVLLRLVTKTGLKDPQSPAAP